MNLSLQHRFFGATCAAGLLVGVLGVALSSGGVPAGAVLVTAPVNSGGSAPVTYEADCTTSLAVVPQVAPFVTSLSGSITPSTVSPTGAKFGFTGSSSATISAFAIANTEASSPSATIGMQWTETIGSTDGHATGTYTYVSNDNPDNSQPSGGGQVKKASWTTGSKQVTGTFPAGLTGDVVALVPTIGHPTQVSPGATVASEASDGTSITLSSPATATTASGLVGYAKGPLTFSDPKVATGNVFTSAGISGETAGIGVTAITEIDVNGALTVPFGGATGAGSANCLETGWDAAGAAGPAQDGGTTPPLETQPGLPAGSTTPLVTAGANPVFPAAATASLGTPVASPPTASPQTVSIATGATTSVVLQYAAGSNPVTSCTIDTGANPDKNLKVTETDTPTVCTVNLVDTDTSATTGSFTFTATDGTLSSTPATVTVNVGTAPVDQPINQVVNGGQLTISCAAPPAIVSTCPTINLPAITLNGVAQTSPATAANPIYVSDNRGDPTVGWSLVTYMVPTATNPNPTCKSLADFCNTKVGGNAANSQIPASDLAISAPTCAPFAGNNNPAATPGVAGSYSDTAGTQVALCQAAAGTSGGTFVMNLNFTLTIPSSVYQGTYQGTVEYLVS